MRKIILASHHLMAHGLKDTIQYVMPDLDQIETICAYMDNQPVEQQFKDVLGEINEQDEYLIFTDMLGGSVNQEAVKYLNYPNVYVVTGMSLPIVLSVVLRLKFPSDDLKLFSAIVVAIFLSIPYLKAKHSRKGVAK